MNEADRKKIYTLLSKFYPNARQLQDRATLTAWGYVLENYPYDDVKAAVLEYAARNKYFPDLSDITGGLEASKPAAVSAPSAFRALSPSERRQMLWSIAFARQLKATLAKAGLPTSAEAALQGMTYAQWHAAVEEARVNMVEILEASLLESESMEV